MAALTFVRLIGDLIGTIAPPAGDESLTTIAAELDRLSMSTDARVPSYFFDAIRRIIAGELSPWVSLPPHEIGLGWALGNISPQIPGTWHDDEPERDVFGVPPLKRAVVIARDSDGERYAVVELSASGRASEPPPRIRPTILCTLVPTDDQLRRWAYDPEMRLATQDGEFALEAASVGLLVQFARDRACPKRARARGAILFQGLRQILIDGKAALPRMAEIATLLRTSGDSELCRDSLLVQTLINYVAGEGPVGLETALEVARLILVGGSAVDLVARDEVDWWELIARDRVPERIYVQKFSGALVYSRESIAHERLVRLGAPHVRASMLGRALNVR